MSSAPAGESGVYYDREDYLGVGRRLVIDVIDVPVALALCGLVVIVPTMAVTDLGEFRGTILLLCAAVWVGYFVPLKRSSIRTLGYIAAGARIVDLRGATPGHLTLLWRMLFASFFPLNYLADLFWLTGDPNRQAIRDKFAGTYVIRRHAQPAGTGPIRYRTYMFWGMTFLFREVAPGAR